MKLVGSSLLVLLAVGVLASSQRPGGRTDESAIPEFEPKRLLETTRRSLQHLPPLTAQVEMAVQVLGQDLKWRGRYLQGAYGTPQYRWDLWSPDGDQSTPQFVQVFDGRFFYLLQHSNLESKFLYADLTPIQNLSLLHHEHLASSAAWFGVGGLASLLEHLQACFEFETVKKSFVGSSSKVAFRAIRGVWTEAALRELLREELQEKWFAGGIQWDRLPKQLPHGVELWIGSDSHLQAFPYRLIFFQFKRRPMGGWKMVPRIVVTLHHVQLLENLPQESFHLSSGQLQPLDLTADYVNRSTMYLQYPVASPR